MVRSDPYKLIPFVRYEYRMEPVLDIHPTKINNEIYYIIETSKNVDFEFKDGKAIKMWDVERERTYFPATFMKWVKDDTHPLHDLYEDILENFELYFKNYNKFYNKMKQRKRINDAIRQTVENAQKSVLAQKNRLTKIPPLTPYVKKFYYNGGGYVSDPPYILTDDGSYIYPTACDDLDYARKCGIHEADHNRGKAVRIYKRAKDCYEYVGTVERGQIGIYTMTYFANKNGIFRLDENGKLMGALYRW